MTTLLDDLQTEAHVWYCNPQAIQQEEKLAAYRSVLSEQEMERYRRFHFDKDRQSYLVSHALLRHALSQYLEIPASEWKFTEERDGKPYLLLSAGMPDISFNLTHTEGLSACIISLDRACGIDAENINRKSDHQAVAERMFAPQELASLSGDARLNFYHYWTLREAYVKALGTGLSGSSKDFYFDIGIDDMNAVVRHSDERQAETVSWLFRLYQPTSDHILSVSVESDAAVEVRCRELSF
jgi:4'-phosphopantetheinyl transferase